MPYENYSSSLHLVIEHIIICIMTIDNIQCWVYNLTKVG